MWLNPLVPLISSYAWYYLIQVHYCLLIKDSHLLFIMCTIKSTSFFCLYIFVTILKPFLPIEVYPCAVLLLWTIDADPNLGYQKTLYAAVVHPCHNYGNPNLDVYTHPIVGFPPFSVRQL